MEPVHHSPPVFNESLDEYFEPMYAKEDLLEHDIHQLQVLHYGEESVQKNRKHILHWGNYYGTQVVVKSASGSTGNIQDRNKIAIHKEQESMKTLVHPNILRLVAFDDTNLVSERFGHSATEMNDYYDMSRIAHDCLSALKHMHSMNPCYRHGNVRAKHIFLERNESNIITRVVLGGLDSANLCSNTDFTVTPGYSSMTSRSSRNDDIVSLAITLVNAYFNTKTPEGVGVYIGFNNMLALVPQTIHSKIWEILKLMLKTADPGFVSEDQWIPFLQHLMDSWINLINEPLPLEEVHMVPQEFIDTYGVDRPRSGSKRRRVSKGGIRCFSNLTEDTEHNRNPPNPRYMKIIDTGFKNVMDEQKIVESDDMDNLLSLPGMGEGFELSELDLVGL